MYYYQFIFPIRMFKSFYINLYASSPCKTNTECKPDNTPSLSAPPCLSLWVKICPRECKFMKQGRQTSVLLEDIVFMSSLTLCISGAWQLPRHNQDKSPQMMTSINYKWKQQEGLAGICFIISRAARRSAISWTSETRISGATNSLINLCRLHLFLTAQL